MHAWSLIAIVMILAETQLHLETFLILLAILWKVSYIILKISLTANREKIVVCPIMLTFKYCQGGKDIPVLYDMKLSKAI